MVRLLRRKSLDELRASHDAIITAPVAPEKATGLRSLGSRFRVYGLGFRFMSPPVLPAWVPIYHGLFRDIYIYICTSMFGAGGGGRGTHEGAYGLGIWDQGFRL